MNVPCPIAWQAFPTCCIRSNREGIYRSMALLTCIFASIPEIILLVKRCMDLYNEPEEYHMPPEPAAQRKEAL